MCGPMHDRRISRNHNLKKIEAHYATQPNQAAALAWLEAHPKKRHSEWIQSQGILDSDEIAGVMEWYDNVGFAAVPQDSSNSASELAEVRMNIVSEGFRTAFALALGLDPEKPSLRAEAEAIRDGQGPPPPAIPIHVLWMCGGPDFHFLTTKTDAQVTMILLTPHIQEPELCQPLEEPENIWMVSNKADSDRLEERHKRKGSVRRRRDVYLIEVYGT